MSSARDIAMAPRAAYLALHRRSDAAFAPHEQIRYLSVLPKRPDAVVKTIELVKGTDRTDRDGGTVETP